MDAHHRSEILFYVPAIRSENTVDKCLELSPGHPENTCWSALWLTRQLFSRDSKLWSLSNQEASPCTCQDFERLKIILNSSIFSSKNIHAGELLAFSLFERRVRFCSMNLNPWNISDNEHLKRFWHQEFFPVESWEPILPWTCQKCSVKIRQKHCGCFFFWPQNNWSFLLLVHWQKVL